MTVHITSTSGKLLKNYILLIQSVLQMVTVIYVCIYIYQPEANCKKKTGLKISNKCGQVSLWQKCDIFFSYIKKRQRMWQGEGKVLSDSSRPTGPVIELETRRASSNKPRPWSSGTSSMSTRGRTYHTSNTLRKISGGASASSIFNMERCCVSCKLCMTWCPLPKISNRLMEQVSPLSVLAIT